MDSFAAMALATEPPKEEIIRGKPYPKNDNIITPVMWRNILGQSFFQILVLCVLLFGGSWIFGAQFRRPDELWTFENGFHYTMIFNTFIFMQVFNEINCRKILAHGTFTQLNMFSYRVQRIRRFLQQFALPLHPDLHSRRANHLGTIRWRGCEVYPSDSNLAPHLCWNRLPLDRVRLLCKDDPTEVLQGLQTKRGASRDELSRKAEGIHIVLKEIEKSFKIILGQNAECIDRAS